MNDCQCTISEGGYCERHKVRKSAPWVRLCQTRESYFRAWEEGRGPGQSPTGTGKLRVHYIAGGPGTELKKLLAKFWIKDNGDCECHDHAVIMDYWGCEKCRSKIDVIVSWMKNAAKKRKLLFSKSMAKLLVKRAIRRAEKIGAKNGLVLRSDDGSFSQ